MSNHNLELLIDAARLLKPLLGELVFVGGTTTALLITDRAAAAVRPTYDVDAIAEISSYDAYAVFSQRLRELGFTEDSSEGAPICRWKQKKIIFDVMPLDEKILGFSNRWLNRRWMLPRKESWSQDSEFGSSVQSSFARQSWRPSPGGER
jgi:hypothetical protein